MEKSWKRLNVPRCDFSSVTLHDLRITKLFIFKIPSLWNHMGISDVKPDLRRFAG
jgi:hypothetical protein